MEFPDEIEALARAAQVFMMQHGLSLDEAVADRVIAALGATSPVHRIVKTAEALYAISDDLNAEGKTLVAQVAHFAGTLGLFSMAVDDRGLRISMAMRRDIGEVAEEGFSWPDPESDPSPLPEFVQQETNIPEET